jgi:hypothetical protein
MNKSLEHIIKVVEGAENMLETFDLTNEDSLSMLNLSVHDAQLALKLGRDAEHNAEYIEIYDSLILRLQVLKSKVDAIIAKL